MAKREEKRQDTGERFEMYTLPKEELRKIWVAERQFKHDVRNNHLYDFHCHFMIRNKAGKWDDRYGFMYVDDGSGRYQKFCAIWKQYEDYKNGRQFAETKQAEEYTEFAVVPNNKFEI